MPEQQPSALPVRPMDTHPISFPSQELSSLSEDAQIMHKYGRGHSFNRDVFDPKTRNRWITPAEESAFQPTERMMVAIRELEDAKLGRYSSSYGHSLSVTAVHDHYTIAYGRGSQLIKVSTFDKYPEEAKLLAVLVGGDLESLEHSAGRLPEVSVRSRHENATDVEHDASSTAQLSVNNPTMPVFAGYGRMQFQGVLTEARLYPLGADPLQQTDEDTGEPGEICTSCETQHPYAPFMPPKATWLEGPVFVIVEALPLRPYLVAATPPAVVS